MSNAIASDAASAGDLQTSRDWREHVMTWSSRLLNPRGRCNRRGLAVIALVLLPAQLLFFAAISAFGGDFSSPVAVAIKVAFLWMAVVAVIKRLHDLGRGAVWFPLGFAIWFGCSLVVAVVAIVTFGPDAIAPGTAGFVFVLVGNMAPMVAAMLYLHFKLGDQGPNRFGPACDGHGFAPGCVSADATKPPVGNVQAA